jgi:hypothetical protein
MTGRSENVINLFLEPRDNISLAFIQDQCFESRHVQGVRRMKDEEDAARSLALFVKRKNDGTFELLQIGLIQSNIEALRIIHLPGKSTPAKHGVLSSDPEGNCPTAYSILLPLYV